MEFDYVDKDRFSFKTTHPTKMYYIVREQTFEHWPQQMTQKPNDLVRKGFVYTGCGDRVTCFYCNVTLKQWEQSDCIEVEHLKWEPNGLFARMMSNQIPNFNLFQCC